MTDAPDAPPKPADLIDAARHPATAQTRARSVATTKPEPGYGRFRPAWFGQAARRVASSLPANEAGLRLAGALRPAALAGLKDEAADVHAFGLSLRLYPRDNLSEKRAFLTPQCFDPHELAALRDAMGPGKVFIDAGARAGLYALIAARAGGPASRVIAVEPDGGLRRRIAFNARQNGLANIDISGVALSDYEGEDVLRYVPGKPGAPALTGAALPGGEAVRVTTLTRLMDDMRVGRVHALKLDAQGGEAAILRAFFADASRERWPDIMILQRADLAGPNGPDAAKLALGRGYQIARTTRTHQILRLTPKGHG
jgi:FkbM family methyltransferase